ncbi:BppU family phage baseplate upper protein [Turicibacter sanguinis]|uniref:BppU family phage baseplate upper protein n=1 Tax=Turicibacter sanguinis TaxID=154288 RepID=UPI001EE6CD8B|nr:BppU family phage baseplate upper protein [Turicibacter sanguinis]
MHPKIYEIILDRYLGSHQEEVIFHQYDTQSSKLEFSFLENGVPFDIPYTRLVLVIQKPDQKEVYQDIELFSGNTAEVILKNQALTVAGELNCQIKMYKNEILESTWSFKIKVKPSIGNDDAIKSEDDYGVLHQLIKDIDQNIEKNNQTVNELVEGTIQVVSENIEKNEQAVQDLINETQESVSESIRLTTESMNQNNQALMEALAQIDESELVRLKGLIELLQQNKLGVNDKASDSTLLNGVSEDVNATINSIVKRTPSGNVVAKYGYGFGETGELGSITVDSNLDRLQHHAIDGSIYPVWDHKNFPVEYGKFTPYIYGLTSGKKLISETSTVFGRYMRVGRMVYVDLRVVWNGKNGVGDSEQVGIAGLPFAPKYAYGSLNIGLHHGIGINLAETSLATYTDASGIKLFVNTKSNWGGLTAFHLATAGSIEMSGHYFIESV